MDCRIVSFSRSGNLACNFWVKEAGIRGKNRLSLLRKGYLVPWLCLISSRIICCEVLEMFLGALFCLHFYYEDYGL